MRAKWRKKRVRRLKRKRRKTRARRCVHLLLPSKISADNLRFIASKLVNCSISATLSTTSTNPSHSQLSNLDRAQHADNSSVCSVRQSLCTKIRTEMEDSVDGLASHQCLLKQTSCGRSGSWSSTMELWSNYLNCHWDGSHHSYRSTSSSPD
jgi:hypothetical protein